MRIDGLHPNSDPKVAGVGVLELNALPKHIHIKPNAQPCAVCGCWCHTTQDENYPHCVAPEVQQQLDDKMNEYMHDYHPSKLPEVQPNDCNCDAIGIAHSHTEVQEAVNDSAIEPTEELDLLIKDLKSGLNWAIDQDQYDLVDGEFKNGIQTLINSRERKAAVSALLKLHTHNRDTETIVDIRRLIAEYERGEANE